MISSPARADDVNSQNSSRSIDLRSPISQDDQIANDLPSNMKTPTVSKGSAPTPPTKLLPINLCIYKLEVVKGQRWTLLHVVRPDDLKLCSRATGKITVGTGVGPWYLPAVIP